MLNNQSVAEQHLQAFEDLLRCAIRSSLFVQKILCNISILKLSRCARAMEYLSHATKPGDNERGKEGHQDTQGND